MKAVTRWFGRLFIDPLSVKELSGISRRWQMYIGRCIYILLISFILWLFWINLSHYDLISPSVFAQLGRNMFLAFFALQLVVVTLSGVSAGSDLITREIRGRTLGLLALTPLTPWRIVAGKWKAAFLQTSTVLLCGAPVFAVCVFLGGVGLRELAYSLTLSIVCASLGAAVALYCSTLFRAGYVATIVTLISLVAYCGLPPMLLFGMLDLDDGGMTLLCWTHPLFAAIGAPGGVGMGRYVRYGWIGATILTSGLILLLLRRCAARVRLLISHPGNEAHEAPSLDDLGRTPAGRSPRIAFLANLIRGRFGVWETNAILWKELSTRRVGGKVVRIGYGLLALLLLSALMTNLDWRATVLWFSWIVLLLIAVANGVSLFVTEREERKWEILLSTPLRARELVFAKLFAGLAAMAPMALVLSVFWFLVGMMYRVPFGASAMMLGAVLLAVLLAYLVGAFASLSAQNQRVAFSSAFGVLIAFLVVFPAVLGLLSGVRILPRGDYLESLIGATNPGYHLGQFGFMLRDTRWADWKEYYARREEEMWSTFQVFAPLYATMIGGLTAWITVRFDRATGRS